MVSNLTQGSSPRPALRIYQAIWDVPLNIMSLVSPKKNFYAVALASRTFALMCAVASLTLANEGGDPPPHCTTSQIQRRDQHWNDVSRKSHNLKSYQWQSITTTLQQVHSRSATSNHPPAVYEFSTLTREECAEIILAAKDVAADRGGWQSNRHAHAATRDVSVYDSPALKRLVIPLANAAAVAAEKLYRVGQVKFTDLFIAKYEARTPGAAAKTDSQTELEAHQDNSVITLQVALSTGSGIDYSGGGTSFSLLNCTLWLRPGCGSLFPGTLWHAGNTVTAGTRFMLVGFSQPVDAESTVVDAVTPADFGARYTVTALLGRKRDAPRIERHLNTWWLRVTLLSLGVSTNASFILQYGEKPRAHRSAIGLVWLQNTGPDHRQLRGGTCEISMSFPLDGEFVEGHDVVLLLLPPLHPFSSYGLRPNER